MSYYRFFRPEKRTPREPVLAITRDEVLKAIKWLTGQDFEVVHFDLETTSLDYANPVQTITNVGLATGTGVYGLNLVDITYEEQKALWSWLKTQPLGGFNLSFDLAWPWREVKKDGRVKQNIEDIQIVTDTALWFRLLANEKHYLQKHNLETMVADILGWPEKYQQKSWLSSNLSKHGATKDEMWKLALKEPEGYTWYCALDAEASYQAAEVVQTTVKAWDFSGLVNYFNMILVNKIKRTIRATSHGVPVDREILEANISLVQKRMLALEGQFLKHDMVRPFMEEYETDELKNRYSLRASLKKNWAKKTDEPWTKPEEYRLEYIADPSKRNKLPTWCREFGGKFYKAETSFTIVGSNKEWPRFNVNSTGQMKWLIYDKWLDSKYRIWYRNRENKKEGGLVSFDYAGRSYQLELTKGGSLPTGGDILSVFGEAGKLMQEYKELKKMLSDFLEKFQLASRRTGYIHPQYKILGTISGRVAGGSN